MSNFTLNSSSTHVWATWSFSPFYEPHTVFDWLTDWRACQLVRCMCARFFPLSRAVPFVQCLKGVQGSTEWLMQVFTRLTSLPRGMPLPRAQVRPMTLATKVLKVRYSFSTTPLKMVFISGMPEPAGGAQWALTADCRLKEKPDTPSNWPLSGLNE